jgi:hypothetical protein
MAASKSRTTTGDRLNSLETQVNNLASTMDGLVNKLGDLTEALTKQHREKQVQATMPPSLPAENREWSPAIGKKGELSMPQKFSGEYMWLRLKPENKARGLKRRRTQIPELGMVIKGGSGAPGDIPIWYAVPVELVDALREYTQEEDDPMSPPLFDIVNDAERADMDQKEEAWRRAKMGVGPMQQGVPQGVRAAKEAAKLSTHRSGRDTPTLVPGAEQFTAGSSQIDTKLQQQIAAQTIMSQSQAPAGRKAALAGLPGPTPDDSDGMQTDIMDLSQLPVTPELQQTMTEAANMSRSPGGNDVQWTVASKK